MSLSYDIRNQRLYDALNSFGDDAHRTSGGLARLAELLSSTSTELASDKLSRIRMGAMSPSIWPPLDRVWSAAVRLVQALEEDEGTQSGTHADAVHSLIVNMAKATRNLVADVPDNQRHAFRLEPHIRQLIVHYTAWSRQDEETSYLGTRMLTQTLSNIVTANDDLQDQLWHLYMNEDSILVRLMASRDPRTVFSTLILILNCVRFNGSRLLTLTSTTTGARICIATLDRLEQFVDSADTNEEVSPLNDEAKVFEIGYSLFSSFFERGIFEEIYNRTAIHDEAITPPQTTALKLLDSYLYSHSAGVLEGATLSELSGQLASLFGVLCGHAQQSIRRAVGSAADGSGVTEDLRSDRATAAAEQEYGHDVAALDLQLPSICRALVLVTHCLVSILLSSEERKDKNRREAHGEAGAGSPVPPTPKDVLLDIRSSEGEHAGSGGGVIESLTETLRLLDIFLPRITFGKEVPSPLAPSPSPTPQDGVDTSGFAYLKRDLVRLLGILSHDSRATQERVRLCGGIPVVLNLCVIDERNPYLREHAIFALRNLLHNNPGNQAIVDAMKPTDAWDAT